MLKKFLNQRYAQKGEPHTHTRIPDQALNIKGGAFDIGEDLEKFYELYCTHIFKEKKEEYLTEKQLEQGAILIDLDFRFATDTERVHTEDDVINIINLYLKIINDLVDVRENASFPIYVFEKPNVNQLADKTKDGIHIVIGLSMEREVQIELRERVLKEIKNICPNINKHLINKWENVVDSGIAKATVNWQLFGSRKPNHEAYELVKHYFVELDDDKEWSIEQDDMSSFDIIKNFPKLCARYPDHLHFNKKETLIDYFNEIKTKNKKRKIKIKEEVNEVIVEQTQDQTETDDDEETLIVAIINNISVKYLTEYSDWIKIVWAMRKVGLDKEFAIKISKKAPNYSDEMFDNIWNSKKCDTVGIGTLKWYSRKSDEYKHFEIIAQFDNFPECLKESTDRVMARLIVDLTEDDIIYQMNEVYVWYNNRWIFDDKGHIVKKVAEHSLIIYFHQLNDMYSKKMIASEPESEEYNSWFNKMKIVKSLILKIHTVSCMRNYYEAVLEELSGSEVVIEFDMKPYLFSFNNKCFDLESKQWIEPSKYDYILTKTGNDYVEPTKEQREKIKILMEQIFPDPEIRKCYMSVLFQGMVGQTTEKFILANGRGRNGKGMTNELFMSLIGNYGYDLNISVLTEKIKGGSNPEIANMHKKRFCIATEPSDSVSINNGTVKKITGGNSMNARMNYSNRTETVLTCTLLMELNTMLNIDGKIGEAEVARFMDIPFVAYYSDDPKEYTNPELNHVYKKDTSLKTPTFKEDHRCALFHYIVEYGGIDEIYQPEIIRERTKAYLTSKDELSNWFFDKYEKDEEGKSVLKVKDIYNLYKEGDLYSNMNKKAKRMMNEKKFKLDLQGHMNFRMFYKERYKKDEKEYRNILLGFRLRQDDDEDKCKVPYPSDEDEEMEEEPEC
tara:strand:- start:199 stop:2898 length:2700 start_codon:yes stop_codon:yes gene_type:complete